MKYESEILEMVHENAMENFKLGFISEDRMREFDKMCLPSEALQDKITNGDNAKGSITHETVNIEHAELETV